MFCFFLLLQVKYYNAESYEVSRFEDAILKYQVSFRLKLCYDFKTTYSLSSDFYLMTTLTVSADGAVVSRALPATFVIPLLLCSGVRVEDPGVAGLSEPNAEPHHRVGPAGRLPALCLLCDRGKVSGSRPTDW